MSRFIEIKGAAANNLKQIDAQIPHGKITVITGVSGSGKSTFVSLIAGINNPSSGSILIDGQDVGNFSADSIRKQIAYIPQDCILFNRTLMENIRYGRLNASDFGSSRYNISTNTDFSGTSPPPAGYYLGSSAEATHVQLRTILANHLHFIHQQNRPCTVSPSSPLSNLAPGTTVTTPPTVSRL